MKKLFKNCLFIILITLLFVTGCDDKKDTHYKPSEYKHNVALNRATNVIESVDREIMSIEADTPANVVNDTYKNSIERLNQELANLENTKKQLFKDDDLTRSELSSWKSSYNSTIKSIENRIKDVKKKLNDFLK